MNIPKRPHARPAPGSVVTVRVPASTSNLGPGFDTLSVALQLYKRIEVTATRSRVITFVSSLSPSDQEAVNLLINEAARLFFKRARCRPFGMIVSMSSDVPLSRGLGCSAALRVGLLAALNELTKAGLDKQTLLELATELEHHPENAAAATFGGFNVAGFVDGRVRCIRSEVASCLKFVTLIPTYQVSTAKARQLVPPMFSRADTLHNLNRAALIAAAFATGQYEMLAGLLEDRVHQPYRETLVPHMNKIIKAGEKAGALGGWLSGSGPSVTCVTLKNAAAVARAMQRQLKAAEVKILAADNVGVKVLSRGTS
ncbi:MAG: homoserine kinase [Verrucomicrobiae bacterium]|nr:homoserine kinase [Verrucomicrobiae bacterium]MCX7723385.1 homoserine kinase [Verrucomicrobiae bacterium]